jgi:hypothetical protein
VGAASSSSQFGRGAEGLNRWSRSHDAVRCAVQRWSSMAAAASAFGLPLNLSRSLVSNLLRIRQRGITRWRKERSVQRGAKRSARRAEPGSGLGMNPELHRESDSPGMNRIRRAFGPGFCSVWSR